MKIIDPILSGSVNSSGSLTIPRGRANQKPSSPKTGSIFLEISDSGSNLVVYNGSGSTGWQTVGQQETPAAPPASADIEYLLVAGGGGGGEGYYGGGGGAGGYLSSSLASVTSGSSFTVTVGSGGSGGSSQSVDGGSGVDSSIAGDSISTITATGGGGGASRESDPGADGGSGGGAARPSNSGGSGTVGQGNDGGTLPAEKYGAGGGGASQAGQVPPGVYSGSPQNDSIGAPGGSGSYSNITGTLTPYAGGGGGGARSTFSSNGIDGGPGGGGAGGAYVAGTAGTVNTGGGGGGGGNNGDDGGAGGSGVAIFAYDSGSINAAGGIVGDAGNGRKYHQFNASDTFKVGSTSDFQIVTDNLQLHLDAGDFASRGTSTWTDLSGNSRNGTVSNATLNGNFYYNFNGSSGTNVTNSSALITGNNARTVEVWYKTTNANDIVFNIGNTASANRTFALCVQGSGGANVFGYTGTYDEGFSGMDINLNSGNWTHWVVTWNAGDPGVLLSYVNGTLRATTTRSAGEAYNTSNGYEVGGWPNNDRPFSGDIAQVRVYSDVLTAAEVLQNYNATKTNFV